MAKFQVTVVFDVEAETKADAAEAVDFCLSELQRQIDVAPEVFDDEAELLGWKTEGKTGWVRG